MTKFDDIDYEPLRSWNRCVMMFNISEDQGLVPAAEYLKQFSDKEKTEMLDMYNKVKLHGPEEVKRQIIRAMPLPEDEVAE